MCDINKYTKIIDKHYEPMQKVLEAELQKELEKDIATIFKWWCEKFPKRKYDLKFYSGNGSAHWYVENFSPYYNDDPSGWYGFKHLHVEDRLSKLLQPMVDFIHAINETCYSDYQNGYGLEPGCFDYLWYENEYLREEKKDD